MKYLLIDGNNLAIRASFANSELKNNDGIPTGVHFGFFQSLINLLQKFNGYQTLIVWDGKSKRRINESTEFVKKGVIPEIYKANRKKEDAPQPLKDFWEQSSFLKRAIGQTGIPQIQLEDFEADDVIASYSKILRNEHEVIICTSDRDYYQLLHENVSLWDGMKNTLTTLKSFQETNGLAPDTYVHLCALTGDDSDNIFGIPSWGETTASKFIKECNGNCFSVIESIEKMAKDYREKYPDITGDEFNRLKSIVTKSGNPKYQGIYEGMPYTGVTLACEDKKIKPALAKSTLMALMFKDRVPLAYSLKTMDNPEVPKEIPRFAFNKNKLMEYFDYYDIESLKDSIHIFETK